MSSRVGKVNRSKVKRTVYVAYVGYANCGHHHLTMEQARNCGGKDATIKAFIPSTNPKVGRTEVPA